MAKETIPDYDSIQFTINEKHEDLLERKLISTILEDGKLAVDLGGGYGRLTNILLDHFDKVLLLDYSTRNLERASKSLDKDRVLFVRADIRNPPILDGSVDFIMSIRVLHHYADISFINSIVKKLKKEGKFLFNFNNISSPMIALHMIRSAFLARKIELNIFNPSVQGVKDSSGNRDIYFASMNNILRKIPAGCSIDRVVGSGLFHNTLVERKAESLNLQRLTEVELLISKVIRYPELYPDVFLLLRNEVSAPSIEASNPLGIIICTSCGNSLQPAGNGANCSKCGKEFTFSNGILDTIS